MNLIEALKNYFESVGGSEINFSEIKKRSGNKYAFYVDLVHPEHGKGRMRCTFLNGPKEIRIHSFTPMQRFFENNSPWDSTIKTVQSVYSGIAGVSGVANRTVNRSLI